MTKLLSIYFETGVCNEINIQSMYFLKRLESVIYCVVKMYSGTDHKGAKETF